MIETLPKISIDTGSGYSMCFGCGQDNPIGLKLSFQRDGKTARAEFTPKSVYQGWSGIVRGGITICLLDEAMSYAALFGGMKVTAEMQTRIRCVASVDQSLIIIAYVSRKTRKLVRIKAATVLNDGTLVAENPAVRFVVSVVDGKSGNGA
ncbi:PaaI family thioesterase [Chloroflexota bacterium]